MCDRETGSARTRAGRAELRRRGDSRSQAARYRWFPGEVAVFRVGLVGSLIVVLVLATRPMDPAVALGLDDKLNHVVAFLFLSLLTDLAFPDRRFGWGKVVFLLGYGLGLELAQWPLLNRRFSGLDLGADALGIGAYVLLRSLVIRVGALRGRGTSGRSAGG